MTLGVNIDLQIILFIVIVTGIKKIQTKMCLKKEKIVKLSRSFESIHRRLVIIVKYLCYLCYLTVNLATGQNVINLVLELQRCIVFLLLLLFVL